MTTFDRDSKHIASEVLKDSKKYISQSWDGYSKNCRRAILPALYSHLVCNHVAQLTWSSERENWGLHRRSLRHDRISNF